jgi:hypothetical protein
VADSIRSVSELEKASANVALSPISKHDPDHTKEGNGKSRDRISLKFPESSSFRHLSALPLVCGEITDVFICLLTTI